MFGHVPSCVAFIFFVLTKAAPEFHSTSTDMAFIKDCNETSPISLDTMNQVLINKKLPGKESNEFQCFLHCLFTKYGWMDEDGGFLLSEIKYALSETSVESSLVEFILYKCTLSPSVDKCFRALQFIECFWQKVKEYNLDKEEQFIYNLEEEM